MTRTFQRNFELKPLDSSEENSVENIQKFSDTFKCIRLFFAN